MAPSVDGASTGSWRSSPAGPPSEQAAPSRWRRADEGSSGRGDGLEPSDGEWRRSSRRDASGGPQGRRPDGGGGSGAESAGNAGGGSGWRSVGEAARPRSAARARGALAPGGANGSGSVPPPRRRSTPPSSPARPREAARETTGAASAGGVRSPAPLPSSGGVRSLAPLSSSGGVRQLAPPFPAGALASLSRSAGGAPPPDAGALALRALLAWRAGGFPGAAEAPRAAEALLGGCVGAEAAAARALGRDRGEGEADAAGGDRWWRQAGRILSLLSAALGAAKGGVGADAAARAVDCLCRLAGEAAAAAERAEDAAPRARDAPSFSACLFADAPPAPPSLSPSSDGDSDASELGEGRAPLSPGWAAARAAARAMACLGALGKAESKGVVACWRTVLGTQGGGGGKAGPEGRRGALAPEAAGRRTPGSAPLAPLALLGRRAASPPRSLFCARAAAATALCEIVEGAPARAFLAVAAPPRAASGTRPLGSFTPLSEALGATVARACAVLTQTAARDPDAATRVACARALGALLAGAPVARVDPQAVRSALAALAARVAGTGPEGEALPLPAPAEAAERAAVFAAAAGGLDALRADREAERGKRANDAEASRTHGCDKVPKAPSPEASSLEASSPGPVPCSPPSPSSSSSPPPPPAAVSARALAVAALGDVEAALFPASTPANVLSGVSSSPPSAPIGPAPPAPGPLHALLALRGCARAAPAALRGLEGRVARVARRAIAGSFPPLLPQSAHHAHAWSTGALAAALRPATPPLSSALPLPSAALASGPGGAGPEAPGRAPPPSDPAALPPALARQALLLVGDAALDATERGAEEPLVRAAAEAARGLAGARGEVPPEVRGAIVELAGAVLAASEGKARGAEVRRERSVFATLDSAGALGALLGALAAGATDQASAVRGAAARAAGAVLRAHVGAGRAGPGDVISCPGSSHRASRAALAALESAGADPVAAVRAAAAAALRRAASAAADAAQRERARGGTTFDEAPGGGGGSGRTHGADAGAGPGAGLRPSAPAPALLGPMLALSSRLLSDANAKVAAAAGAALADLAQAAWGGGAEEGRGGRHVSDEGRGGRRSPEEGRGLAERRALDGARREVVAAVVRRLEGSAGGSEAARAEWGACDAARALLSRGGAAAGGAEGAALRGALGSAAADAADRRTRALAQAVLDDAQR